MDITELVDRTLIVETLHRYCHYVDHCDLDGVLTLFADDARVDMGQSAVFCGHKELHALLADRLGQWTGTSHQSSTARVTRYDGATADTTSYLYVLHDDAVHLRAMHLWGRYDDELRRTDAGWKFVRRRLLVTAVRQTDSAALPPRFEPVPRLPLPHADGLPVA